MVNETIKKEKASQKKQVSKMILSYFLLTVATVVLVIILRVFLFASFKIPSPSMEPALMSGDYIIVNKLIPGPRLFQNFNFKDDIKTTRLKGWRSIKRNDIIVFNYPYSNWNKLKMDINVYYVKRCVAIPGDTFYIENGISRVAGISDTLGYYLSQKNLSNTDSSELKKIKGIYNSFPFDTIFYNWNIKKMGPLYVPKADENIAMDTLNIKLYKNLIEYETGKSITLKDGKILLNGKAIDSFTFKQNYYFMAGDQVLDSKDSRYWGLLPEDHIIGKAAFIWKSQDSQTNKYRFDRFFKSIN